MAKGRTFFSVYALIFVLALIAHEAADLKQALLEDCDESSIASIFIYMGVSSARCTSKAIKYQLMIDFMCKNQLIFFRFFLSLTTCI